MVSRRSPILTHIKSLHTLIGCVKIFHFDTAPCIAAICLLENIRFVHGCFPVYHNLLIKEFNLMSGKSFQYLAEELPEFLNGFYVCLLAW